MVDPGFALVADKPFVDRAHALGLKVIPWTINDADTMRAQIATGADGIITDYPTLLRNVMAQLGMPLPGDSNKTFGWWLGRWRFLTGSFDDLIKIREPKCDCYNYDELRGGDGSGLWDSAAHHGRAMRENRELASLAAAGGSQPFVRR